MSKKSPAHATIIGTLDMTDGKTTLTTSKSNGKIDTSGYYSPMNGNGVKNGGGDRFQVTRSSPASFLDSLDRGCNGGVEMNEYYRPDSDHLDPLLSASVDNQLTVGSYVQPGYIYVCDNYS